MRTLEVETRLKKSGWLVFGAFIITALLILFLFWNLHMAPFGGASLARADATIQYIDFFTYLRGILLEGKSTAYTFTKGLGSNVWGVVAYYLLSPLNLLVIFFRQENLHTFYDLLVLLKLSLCSGTMAFYLEKRFDGGIPSAFLVLLAISYGLMQYNFEQAQNVMWLDPLYMLPLLLLGTWKLQSNKGFLMLAISVGFALLFNWYMGMIVTLFAGFWSAWEYLALSRVKDSPIRAFLRYEGKVLGAILLGVCLSGIVLVPAFASMASGRGHVDWRELSIRYKGNPLTLLQGMSMGNVSQKQFAVLFSGSFSLAGTVIFLSGKSWTIKQKKWALVLLMFILLAFYWEPFYFLFSLLKLADSYWYRYSFVGIFPLLYFAAWNCTRWDEKQEQTGSSLKILSGIIVYWMVFNVLKHQTEYRFLLFSAGCLIGIGAMWLYRDWLKERKIDRWAIGGICLLSILELGLNVRHLMKRYTYSEVTKFHVYVEDAQAQIREIKQIDTSLYRINQVHPYRTSKNNITANYNEPLSYGYWGISSYTSGPDNRQMQFLDHVGYRQGSVNLNVVVAPVLGIDALLGVKYVFAPKKVYGLELESGTKVYNQECTWRNPYAFPLAFLMDAPKVQKELRYTGNPFLYTNTLFSVIAGKTSEIYQPVMYQTLSRNEHRILFQLKEWNKGPVYGNIPTQHDLQGQLLLDRKEKQGYTRWLSPSVFPLSATKKGKHTVQLDTKERIPDDLTPQFYGLDLKVLQDVSQEAWQKAAVIKQMNDRQVIIEVHGSPNQLLFTSIPYDKGWDIRVNGQKAVPFLIGGCLMAIPLEGGGNTIKMEYHLPGLTAGIALTMLGIIGCAGYWRWKQG